MSVLPNMATERETAENADERRELAMAAAAASLRSRFKPKNGISATQVSKFQELHKRRLQIKAKPIEIENKRGKGKSYRNRRQAKECSGGDEPSNAVGESSTPPILRDTPSVEEDIIAGKLVTNKRRKLHWGLDTKERWEQKSNM